MIWISLYIIGCILAAVCFVLHVRYMGILTLGTAIIGLFLISFSWIEVIVFSVTIADNIVIWKKKEEEK